VTQALAEPVVYQSHVHGDLTYETVMSPGKSAVRIDLSGHLAVNWPAIDGIGPVLPENFKATLVLSIDYTEGGRCLRVPDGPGDRHLELHRTEDQEGLLIHRCAGPVHPKCGADAGKTTGQ
jgi:Domain of unknown function (DUF1842)